MIRSVSTEQLTELIERGDTAPESPSGRVHVFDLRDPESFRRGHVPGARHTPQGEALRWIPQRALTQELVVLIDEDGALGGPARHVAHELAHKWFRRVRYLQGGFAAWSTAGGPSETGGATGVGANSHDGTTETFQTSSTVPWHTAESPGTPDPTRTGQQDF